MNYIHRLAMRLSWKDAELLMNGLCEVVVAYVKRQYVGSRSIRLALDAISFPENLMDSFDGIKPFYLNARTPFEIHMLTSAYDAELATWALLSWYWVGKRQDALCIHDDGSLRPSDKNRFQALFPGCRIVSRGEADTTAQKELKNYPNLLNFRRGNNLSMKLLDFSFYARTRKLILLDSDVFVFGQVNGIEGYERFPWNLFLSDYQFAFNVARERFVDFSAASSYLPINTGFGVIDSTTLDLDLAEKILAHTDCNLQPYWAEQTLYAILSAPFGIELLDDSHVIAREAGLVGVKMKHYVWKNRMLARQEAIPFVRNILSESY
jgi:hypothetical protein